MTLDLAHICAQLRNVDLDYDGWFDEAACRGMDTNLWMPERGDNKSARQAVIICNGCDVKWNCLAYGMQERVGIWGGQTDKARRTIARAMRNNERAKPGPKERPINHGTWQGAQAHWRRGEDACEACRHAWTTYSNEHRRNRQQAANG